MAHPTTNLPPSGGFSGAVESLFGGLGTLLGAATPVLQTVLPALLPQRTIPVALPGGASIGLSPAQFAALRAGQPQFQQAGLGALAGPLIAGGLGALGEQFFNLIPGGAGQTLLPAQAGGACIAPTAQTTIRLPSRVDVPTRDAAGNQRFTTFKNMGRPILWSGDVAAAKRVKRISSRVAKFGRRRGGR